MATYCTVQQAKDMLGGQWGAAYQTGSGSNRDSILGDLAERMSRMFDRECGVATNHFAGGTGITRRYAGSGSQWLEIEDWDAITAVAMTSNQQRSDVQTLTVTDNTSPNYVEVLPLEGPPFNRLFLLRGWLPDVFNVGNVAITGSMTTPADVTHAVAVWAAYEWRARDAGWQDAAGRPDGPGLLYVRGIPPETARVIAYYKSRLGGGTGPKMAFVGGAERRTSRWLDWITAP